MHWIAPSEKDAANDTLEKRLWAAADQLRANSGLTSQQYSLPVLGLIFLRFAEVRFDKRRAELEKQAATSPSSRRSLGVGGRVDDPTAYHAEGVIYLSVKARFATLLNLPEGADVGKAVNDAMADIEKQNPQLAGVLPRTYQVFTSTLLKELLKKVSEIPATLAYDAFGRVTEVERKNDEGRTRPQRTHQAVCAADHPSLRKPAENNGSPGARQTTAAVGNVRGRELSGSASRTEQSRVHRQVRRLPARVGGNRLLAGTARRGWNRVTRGIATTARRMRRVDRHLRHDHQTSEGARMKVKGRMQNAELLFSTSSFLLLPSTLSRPAITYYEDLHQSTGRFDFVLAKGSKRKPIPFPKKSSEPRLGDLDNVPELAPHFLPSRYELAAFKQFNGDRTTSALSIHAP